MNKLVSYFVKKIDHGFSLKRRRYLFAENIHKALFRKLGVNGHPIITEFSEGNSFINVQELVQQSKFNILYDTKFRCETEFLKDFT